MTSIGEFATSEKAMRLDPLVRNYSGIARCFDVCLDPGIPDGFESDNGIRNIEVNFFEINRFLFGCLLNRKRLVYLTFFEVV